MHSCDVAGGHDYVYENISSPARCEFGRPRSPISTGDAFRGKPKVALRAKPLLKARNESRPTSHRPHRLFVAHARSRLECRLADEERPVQRALVVLPPRHMTAAPRHQQSRSARLRGQLRPSDDRLFSDRWARSLSGPSPACRSPVRLAARGPLACSPPPPRVPAPPRFPAPDGARAAQTARSGRQSSGRPGGRCSAPSESVRPRVLLPPPPPLHPVPVCRESCFVYVYVVYVTLEPLSP